MGLPSRPEECRLPDIRIRHRSCGQTCCGARTFLAEGIRFHHGEEIRRFCGIEEEEEAGFACGDGISLVTEISGNGAGHYVKGCARKAQAVSRIRPGAAGGLIPKHRVQNVDDFRHGDELFNIAFLEIQDLSVSTHFVSITKTPSQSSPGEVCFKWAQRSTYMLETKSFGWRASDSRNAAAASSQRRSR